jgi:hypothetical protein
MWQSATVSNAIVFISLIRSLRGVILCFFFIYFFYCLSWHFLASFASPAWSLASFCCTGLVTGFFGVACFFSLGYPIILVIFCKASLVWCTQWSWYYGFFYKASLVWCTQYSWYHDFFCKASLWGSIIFSSDPPVGSLLLCRLVTNQFSLSSFMSTCSTSLSLISAVSECCCDMG